MLRRYFHNPRPSPAQGSQPLSTQMSPYLPSSPWLLRNRSRRLPRSAPSCPTARFSPLGAMLAPNPAHGSQPTPAALHPSAWPTPRSQPTGQPSPALQLTAQAGPKPATHMQLIAHSPASPRVPARNPHPVTQPNPAAPIYPAALMDDLSYFSPFSHALPLVG